MILKGANMRFEDQDREFHRLMKRAGWLQDNIAKQSLKKSIQALNRGMTNKQYNQYSGEVRAIHAAQVEQTNYKDRQNPIDQRDIAKLKQLLDAPVELFLKLI